MLAPEERRRAVAPAVTGGGDRAAGRALGVDQPADRTGREVGLVAEHDHRGVGGGGHLD
jgi:hypothetical protein